MKAGHGGLPDGGVQSLHRYPGEAEISSGARKPVIPSLIFVFCLLGDLNKDTNMIIFF